MMKTKKIVITIATMAMAAAVCVLPSKALYINGSFSAEAAKAYQNVTDRLIASYGTCTVADNGYFQGLANVTLADFDGDGYTDLYVAYCSNPRERGAHVNREEIWRYNGTTALRVASSEIANFGADVSPETKILYKDGQALIAQGTNVDAGGKVIYRTVEGTSMKDVYTYTYPKSGTCTVNGVSMSRTKANAEIKKFESGYNVYDVMYVSTNTTSSTLKADTQDTLNLLNARAIRTTATPNDCKMRINSVDKKLGSYMIKSNNYVKLRDIATLMNGTSGQFNVSYNAVTEQVLITTNRSYLSVGGELAGVPTEKQSVYINALPLTVDGVSKSFTSSLIGGNNYVRLRDLGKTLDFYVGYEASTETVIIDTSRGYTE